MFVSSADNSDDDDNNNVIYIAAMPESSAWQDIQRWELRNHGNIAEDDLDDELVIHNELYVSEEEAEDDDRGLEVHSEMEAYESSDERQSHISGISQQDRDNKTILLRQAASGKSPRQQLHVQLKLPSKNSGKNALLNSASSSSSAAAHTAEINFP